MGWTGKCARFLPAAVLLLYLPVSSMAADKIALHALFKNKAILVIDGSRRVLSTGETSPEGVKLIGTDTRAETAEIEIDGKPQSIHLGVVHSAFSNSADNDEPVVLWAGSNGFFHTGGSINGVAVRFLVDTGASTIAMNSAAAVKIGLDYKKGSMGVASTAGGYVRTYNLKLYRVTIGNITLHNIDAGVIEGSHPQEILLGMSFLGRLDMKREGRKLELRRRY